MRLRTFVLLSMTVTVVAGNTALLLWMKGRRGRTPLRAALHGPVAPPSELRVVLRTRGEAAPAPGAEASGPSLRVQATDADGAPLSGVEVVAEGDRSRRPGPFPEEVLGRGTTGADGTCGIALARRARTRLVASKEGFAPTRVEAAGPTVAIRMLRAAAIRGRVVEEGSGAPVAGARVTALVRVAEPEASATTAEDGAFLLAGLVPGTWTLEAESDDRPPARRTLAAPGGQEVAVEIPLPRGYTVRGRVVYSGSDRVAAEGTVHWPGHRPLDGRGRSAPLGPDGRFAIRGLPGLERYFRVETMGVVHGVRGQRPEVDPATGEQVGEILVALPSNSLEGLGYRGVVRDGAGRPVEGAVVYATADVLRWGAHFGRGTSTPLEPPARTDAEGRYRIPAATGNASVSFGWELLVLHPGFAPKHFVPPARSRNRAFDLVLDRAVSVTVDLRTSAGTPAEGAEVFALLRHSDPGKAHLQFGEVGAGLAARAITDARGVARLERLGPGSWYLVARSADGKEGCRVVMEIEAGAGDLDAVVALRRLPSVAGRVVDSSGAPVAGAWVGVEGEDLSGARPQAAAGADGRFVLHGILALPAWEAMGGVPAMASGDGGSRSAQGVLLPFDGEAELVLVPGAPAPR